MVAYTAGVANASERSAGHERPELWSDSSGRERLSEAGRVEAVGITSTGSLADECEADDADGLADGLGELARWSAVGAAEAGRAGR